MGEYRTEKLEDLIDRYRFEEAAQRINERHRILSEDALSVFEDLFRAFVEPTFRGDLQNLRGLLKIGNPSPRSNLRRFISNPKVQNCLTAILKSLEKDLPPGVNMGFHKASGFFRESDVATTYSADILNYEPEFSRLTDQRLQRLLSSPPNTIDLELLPAEAVEKKKAVHAFYQKESLDPIRGFFKEARVKCEGFFHNLEEHSKAFRDFLQYFREREFSPDEKIISSWIALGDEYFQLELLKSSLMLPVSPKALYWGMQEDYPATLAALAELKEMVTPLIEVGEPEKSEAVSSIDIVCRNPGTLKTAGFSIKPSFQLATSEGFSEVAFSCRLLTLESNRRYRYLIELPPATAATLHTMLQITCDAHCYPSPFTVEKSFDL